MHVFHIAQEMLEGFDPHPDVREGGRWIKVDADPSVPDSRIDGIAEKLRECGYHVSVMGTKIKATKQDVHWPETAE